MPILKGTKSAGFIRINKPIQFTASVIAANLNQFPWSDVYFVDGTNGSDSNDGKQPDLAKSSINSAITLASKNDVIYIAPKDWVSGNLWIGSAYQDTSDLSVPYAKSGLALIGTSHQGFIGPPYSTVLREKSGTTSPILTVNAPMVAIENLAFTDGSSTLVKGLYINGNVAGTSESALTSVYNCYFYNVGFGTSTGSAGALFSDGAWGTTVDSCTFMTCKIGVMIQSEAATSGLMTVRNCTFFSKVASAASDIACDICLYAQGSSCCVVTGNNFAHLLPSAGGLNRYVSVQDVRQGIVSNNYCGHTAVLTNGPGGSTGISTPTYVGVAHNYCAGALMALST